MKAEEFLKTFRGYSPKATSLSILRISIYDMAKTMEEYFEQEFKNRVNAISDDEILLGAIQQDSMNEQVAWGDGAKWFKEQLLKQ